MDAAADSTSPTTERIPCARRHTGTLAGEIDTSIDAVDVGPDREETVELINQFGEWSD